jgi:hypothetical protein
MKKIVASLCLLLALAPFCEYAYAQVLDTLMMPFMSIGAGDTVTVPIYLRNHSFAVGGIATRIVLTDSTYLNIVNIYRGTDIQDFAYYAGTFTGGGARLVTVANMPNYPPITPLAPGIHEIARIRVAASESLHYGGYAIIFFDRIGPPVTSLSDSSGYLVKFPYTLDGVLNYQHVAIDGPDNPQPAEFELGSCYPNPFNSSTNIDFSIAKPGRVTLKIYDLLGREVANLFDQFANAGNYQVNWDGKSVEGNTLSSGVYFYRLSYGSKGITKKFSMVK